MNKNAEQMIRDLTPEIEKKCAELKTARRERCKSVVFVIMCIAAVLIPVLWVIFGWPFALLIVPIVFMSLCAVLLLPILLSGKTEDQGGIIYE